MGDLSPKRTRPAVCHLFFGEEVFPAYLFLDELRESQAVRGGQPLERFDLSTQEWREVLDAARTASLFTVEARIILVESPAPKRDQVPGPRHKLTEPDKKLLSAYLEDPVPGTILVIIYPGRIRATSPVVKFFSSFPADVVQVKELRPLRYAQLRGWIGKRFHQRGKSVGSDVADRLVDLVGEDLRSLENEVEKLVTFVGEERKQVQMDDVDQASGWVKSYVEWELSEHLEKADYQRCVEIMHRLLEQEGITPVRILGLISGFFRDILLAKLRLQEGQRDKKSIFREIKPQIKESFRKLYDRQFRQLFVLAEGISWKDLQHTLARLRDLDLKLKTTNLVFQTMMEGFLYDYCRIRRGERRR